MPFALTFEYVPGEHNGVSDALSRSPWLAASVTVVRAGAADIMKLLSIAVEQDSEYIQIRREVQAEVDRRDADAGGVPKRYVWNGLVRITEGGGEAAVLVPASTRLRAILLAEAHDPIVSGHYGSQKTLALMREHWRWEGMAKDVEEYVHTCVRCQKVKVKGGKQHGE